MSFYEFFWIFLSFNYDKLADWLHELVNSVDERSRKFGLKYRSTNYTGKLYFLYQIISRELRFIALTLKKVLEI